MHYAESESGGPATTFFNDEGAGAKSLKRRANERCNIYFKYIETYIHYQSCECSFILLAISARLVLRRLDDEWDLRRQSCPFTASSFACSRKPRQHPPKESGGRGPVRPTLLKQTPENRRDTCARSEELVTRPAGMRPLCQN